jgi:chemotaxis protein CheC
MDALREVASIGAGHAATALSQMTQQRIMITVPEITVSGADGASHSVAGLEDPKEIAAAVSMRMLGDLTGHTMFVIPKQNAKLLCDMLLRRDLGSTSTFDELETSSLKEAGNIVGGAFMTALSTFMGMLLLPSVPSIVFDAAAEIQNRVSEEIGADLGFALCVETDFHLAPARERGSPRGNQEISGDDEPLVRGHILFFPDMASLDTMFDALRVA